jgi:predicted negative regulator of RcsB-dependent stress response
VTELEDKASRRAQRREQQQNDSSGAEAPDGPETEQEALDESSGSGNAVQQIRDRNARIRAQAAEERRAKRDRDRVAVAAPTGLDAAERVDDLFVRSTHAAAGWVRKNFRWLQWVVILSVAGGFGYQIHRYVSRSKAAKSTDALFIGVIAESGTVRPAADDESANANSELAKYDPRPVYASAEARTAAAEEGYRKVVAAHGNTGPGWVARLGLAGILYDQKKWDDALSQYRAVRGSELAKTDGDLLGRSLEGIGLCLEAKGDRQGALTAFRELTNQESAPWLATLGLFHQSRLLLAEGNKEKAKELATKAKERLDKEEKEREGQDREGKAVTGMPRSSYLSESVKMLLARIDPNAASAPNIQEILQKDPDKLQKLLQGLQKKQPPAAPSAPGGAP